MRLGARGERFETFHLAKLGGKGIPTFRLWNKDKALKCQPKKLVERARRNRLRACSIS